MKWLKKTQKSWEEWLHDTRIRMTSSDLDWVLHVGRSKQESQAHSRPSISLGQFGWMDLLRMNLCRV